MVEFERIRNSRSYTSRSLRLDMAERGTNFSTTLWETFVSEKLDQLDILAYPDYATISNLEKRIASKFFSAETDVILDCGSDALIKLMIEALCDQNQKVLTLTPSFPMYGIYTQALKREIYDLSADNLWQLVGEYFHVDMNEILRVIKESNARLFFISNPISPLGGCLKTDEVVRILSALRDTGGYLCLDQAYIDFQSHEDQIDLEVLKNFENLIILRTFSKGPGLAGLRLGYCAGKHELIAKLRQNQLTFPITGPAIKFCDLLLDNYHEVTDYAEATINTRQTLVKTLQINKQEVINSHTNSIHFRLTSELRDKFNRNVNKFDVKIKMGNNIGTPVRIPNSSKTDWIRMSIFAGFETTEFYQSLWE
jgi:histidinol-phosphate aminotransferase